MPSKSRHSIYSEWMNEQMNTGRKTVRTSSEPHRWPSVPAFTSNLRDRHAGWIERKDRNCKRRRIPLNEQTYPLWCWRRREKPKIIQRVAAGYLPRAHSHLHRCRETRRRAALMALRWKGLLGKHSLALLICWAAVHFPPWKAWLVLVRPWHLAKLEKGKMCIQLKFKPEQWESQETRLIERSFLMWVIQKLFPKGLACSWILGLSRWTQRGAQWLATRVLSRAEATVISIGNRDSGVQGTWNQVPFLPLSNCADFICLSLSLTICKMGYDSFLAGVSWGPEMMTVKLLPPLLAPGRHSTVNVLSLLLAITMPSVFNQYLLSDK